jgi:indolepyruvate ferredoxin oxidoreductase alpha subunit
MHLPVMVRMVTRLSHSRSGVEPREPLPQKELRSGARQCWTLLPTNARIQFQRLLELQPDLIKYADASPFNTLELNPEDRSLGVIASGIAYNYLLENYAGAATKPSILKVSTYPIPTNLVTKLIDHVDAILVAEEGYPLIERMLKGTYGIHGKNLLGKLSGNLPLSGELSPEIVRQALALKPLEKQTLGDFKLAGRPPQLCVGCPHADTFKALNEALREFDKSNVFSDIGCYTLGYFPPHNALNTCVCMGASVGMAKGAAEAGVYPSVAVIGDSTFGHSGITPLLSAVTFNTNIVVIILDNCTVAMTGGQRSFATGDRLLKIVEGVGVPKDHIRMIVPLPKNHEKNVRILSEEIEHPGISVIVAVRECVEEARKRRG